MTKRRSREPVFVEHEPILNHPPEAWRFSVPYPYQFKWDGGWILVLMLFCMGLVWKPWLLLAGFITLLRCVVWCSYRFPLTTYFFVCLLRGLFGRRRRW